MRRECQRRCFTSQGMGTFACSVDDDAMTAMHAVEIADRDHGAGKRTSIDAMGTAAQNMERFSRRGSIHRISGRSWEVADIDLHIFSSREHSERGYG